MLSAHAVLNFFHDLFLKGKKKRVLSLWEECRDKYESVRLHTRREPFAPEVQQISIAPVLRHIPQYSIVRKQHIVHTMQCVETDFSFFHCQI